MVVEIHILYNTAYFNVGTVGATTSCFAMLVICIAGELNSIITVKQL